MKLTDICRPKQWKTIPKTALKEQGYPVYGANGVIGRFDSYNHEHETILIGCRGTCGNVCVCEPYSYVTGNAMCLDELDSAVDMRYLECYLQSYDFSRVISGTSQPQITRQGLSKVLIPLAPFDVQLHIAAEFSHLSSIEDNCEKQLNELDDLVKSRFIEMFENMKCNGTVAGVAETFNGDRGKNYPSANDKVSDGLPFVNAGNLKNGSVSFDDMDYITREKYETLSGGKICKGDILYCLRGSLGKSALVDFDEGTIASSLMIIRPNLEVVTSRYLYEALNSPLVIRQMHAADNGSSQPNLSAKSVKAYNIPIPPLALQQQFADFVTQVDKLRFDVQQQIEKLETLKQSLMQEYFG